MLRTQIFQTIWSENRGKFLFLLSTLLLIGSLQLWQGFWIDTEIAASSRELSRVQKELRLNQQRVTEGGGAQITGLADDLKNFYQGIPGKVGLGSFIGRLYSYATDAGIEIAQISYSTNPVEEMDLLGYDLSFTVSGSYLQVKKFIHLIENSPTLMIVDSISLAGARRMMTETVTLRLQLQTFFREVEQ